MRQPGDQSRSRLRHPLGGLVTRFAVLCIIISASVWGGCTSTDGQATADDVNNKAFTFANGAVLHPALTNVATTLAFTERANAFTLTSSGGMANGSVRFGPCLLTVTNSRVPPEAAYAPGTGPQTGEVLALDPCIFDDTTRALTVTHGSITATSQPALAQVVNATAADLNNRTFLFGTGEMFHAALKNLATSIRFTNNATTFTLSSNNTDGATRTARGNHRFAAGACIVTVTSTDYPVMEGPQNGTEITLQTCQFNSATGFLILSSDGTNKISSL